MREYTGAVAYLDLLGIGPLTRGEIALNRHDFDAFEIPPKFKVQRHRFAAVILVIFRKALLLAQHQYGDVKFSQLSDSAFLWSEKPLDLVNAARQVMWHVILSGVLCRGGLSYGSIVEPRKVNKRIGAFILGEAVTGAVNMERAGKGCRLFSDAALPRELSSGKGTVGGWSWSGPAWDASFAAVRNPLDGSVVDEFRWYFYRDALSTTAETDRTEHRMLGIVELLAHLRLSPRFRWNTKSRDGLRQIGVSIESISQCTHQFGDEIDYAESAEIFLDHPTAHRGIELVKTEFMNRKNDIAVRFRRRKKHHPRHRRPVAQRKNP